MASDTSFVEKPGTVIAAAVLGFIQAGAALVATVLLFAELIGDSGRDVAEGWIVGIALLASTIMLIFGTIRLLSGIDRRLFISALGLQLAICLYLVIKTTTEDNIGIAPGGIPPGSGHAKFDPIIFLTAYAVLPVVALILALSGSASRWLRARRNNR